MMPSTGGLCVSHMPQSSFQSHQPSAEVLRWVIDSVGPGARIESVSPLHGATSSALHRINVNCRGRTVRVVLRQFVSAEWLKVEPDLALHEALSLQKASRAGLPTPELIAFDESGDRCGYPTTLMTHLPGSVELRPTNLGDWLSQLAAVLPHVHALGAEDYPWSYYPYNDIQSLETPDWSKFPKQWERAIEVVTGPRPEARECFIHRDYHPNNVLWQDGRLSGVIDWVNACRGPAVFDLAWCRLNLARLYGLAEADRFLSAYRSLAGASFEYHPYWDLIAAIELLPGPPDVYPGWPAFGIDHLNTEIIRERVDHYLVSALARL